MCERGAWARQADARRAPSSRLRRTLRGFPIERAAAETDARLNAVLSCEMRTGRGVRRTRIGITSIYPSRAPGRGTTYSTVRGAGSVGIPADRSLHPDGHSTRTAAPRGRSLYHDGRSTRTATPSGRSPNPDGHATRKMTGSRAEKNRDRVRIRLKIGICGLDAHSISGKTTRRDRLRIRAVRISSGSRQNPACRNRVIGRPP